MNIKPIKIQELIAQINFIVKAIETDEFEEQKVLGEVDPIYLKSARNLIHYNAFRKFDLRAVQKKLGNLGMSRFVNVEGHVKDSLLKTNFILERLIGNNVKAEISSGVSIKNGKRLLTKHTKQLLGYRSKGRRVRIMVTQPTQAAYDYQVVHDMVSNGMNCARINCAHDNPEVWAKIIENVRQASKALNRNVKIAMDLAGPKVRTGEIEPGAKLRKFSPERDVHGNVIRPVRIELVSEIEKMSEANTLVVDAKWLEKLTLGDKLSLIDTRNKVRKFKVVILDDGKIVIQSKKTSYIKTGTILCSKNPVIGATKIGEIEPIQQSILLRDNDVLIITKEAILGTPTQFDIDGNCMKKARISCQVPEVFEHIQVGEKILFDDGKLEGFIEVINTDSFEVRIIRAKENGVKLKAEKGINFPTTNLGISGLTDKDKIDLEFVAEHADIVNFSFVNSKQDVEELLFELKKYKDVDTLGIILKIETRFAFDNLVEILLAAMKAKNIGVMIARGDLAVETGWDVIGKVQEEILSLCAAAHVPVVWATQVLENLAQKGLPSRSEITDATTSLEAECVMLNKGPYMNDVLQLLGKILSDMENLHEKKEEMLPKREKL